MAGERPRRLARLAGVRYSTRMLPTPAAQLFAAAGLPPDAAAGMADVDDLAYDSRQVRPGSLFVAWRGARHVGAAFAAQAQAQGAVGMVAEAAAPGVSLPVCQVADARLALAHLARALWRDPAASLRMVGVTGTNGKTTCVAAIAALMAAHAGPASVGRIGTLGAQMGSGQALPASPLTTPEASDLVRLLADMRAAGVASVAMEASSQALAQQRLAGVAFDVALFTQLGDDHHDWHGGPAATFAAKARLFADHLKPGGVAVVPEGDVWAARLPRPPGGRRLTWGPHPGADVFPLQVSFGLQGTRLRLQTPVGVVESLCPLIGVVNLANILAACAVGCALGLSAAALATGLAQTGPPPGRMQCLAGARGLPQVVVDYAHTPMAVAQVLASLRPLIGGQILCVLGCGGERDRGKRQPMGAAAAAGADRVWITNDNPRGEDPAAIAASIAAGVPAGRRHILLDRRAAIAAAIAAAGPDDCVAVLGRGHEPLQHFAATSLPMADAAWAEHCLAAVGPAAPS